MEVKFFFYLMIIVCCGIDASRLKTRKPKPAKFLLVLLDGFRWNYLDRGNLPNFARFFQQGVRSEYMQPSFPSLSYPGYYSIVTGLYAENHGFIDNTMYDRSHNMFFTTDTNENGSQPFWWEQSVPIWITATQSKLKTYVYQWPGCHVIIHNTVPTYFEKYQYFNDTIRLQSNIQEAIAKLSSDDADVAIVYSEYTDIIGHKYGPESDEMIAAVKNIDSVIGLMLQNLESKSMKNKVNIIIVSDHGMTKSDHATAARVKITDAVQMEDIEFLLGYGAEVGVHPVEGKFDKVYSQLKNLSGIYVWKKDEIPEELHFKNNDRVPPIQVVAKKGYFIEAIANNSKQVPPTKPNPMEYNGFHGYIPTEVEDMRAIFLAMGPGFKKNLKYGPIHMTDVYNVMVHLTGLKGHPNNGSWSAVKYILKNGENAVHCSGNLLSLFCYLGIIISRVWMT